MASVQRQKLLSVLSIHTKPFRLCFYPRTVLLAGEETAIFLFGHNFKLCLIDNMADNH